MIRITAAVVVKVHVLGQRGALVQHLAVTLLDHVVPHGIQRVERPTLLVTPDADKVPADLLRQIPKQSLHVDAKLRVRNEERMLHAHVLDVLDQVLAVVQTKQTIVVLDRIVPVLVVPLVRIDLLHLPVLLNHHPILLLLARRLDRHRLSTLTSLPLLLQKHLQQLPVLLAVQVRIVRVLRFEQLLARPAVQRLVLEGRRVVALLLQDAPLKLLDVDRGQLRDLALQVVPMPVRFVVLALGFRVREPHAAVQAGEAGRLAGHGGGGRQRRVGH